MRRHASHGINALPRGGVALHRPRHYLDHRKSCVPFNQPVATLQKYKRTSQTSGLSLSCLCFFHAISSQQCPTHSFKTHIMHFICTLFLFAVFFQLHGWILSAWRTLFCGEQCEAQAQDDIKHRIRRPFNSYQDTKTQEKHFVINQCRASGFKFRFDSGRARSFSLYFSMAGSSLGAEVAGLLKHCEQPNKSRKSFVYAKRFDIHVKAIPPAALHRRNGPQIPEDVWIDMVSVHSLKLHSPTPPYFWLIIFNHLSAAILILFK